MWSAGVDEAGRGPVIGPLVVGAVAVPQPDVALLVEYGIRDSKDLTHAKRLQMAAWFHEQASERGWLHGVPNPNSRNFSTEKHVIIPAIKTGIVIGAIFTANSINSHPAIFAINKF